ncbi:MAG: response regulator [Verrucomicrobia bacterium]|nr:response regulator [Verrucomicrobiota bacterium]
MVVDDDVSVCRAFSRLLKSCGFDVRTYTSTESFFDAETPCDKCVLILDIRMPGIDGLEVQDIIRKTNPATPIVFVTAHEDEEARTRALDGGARAFLRKPVNEEDLLRAVNEAMGGVE